MSLNFFGASSKIVLRFPVPNTLFPLLMYFDYVICPLSTQVLFLGVYFPGPGAKFSSFMFKFTCFGKSGWRFRIKSVCFRRFPFAYPIFTFRVEAIYRIITSRSRDEFRAVLNKYYFMTKIYLQKQTFFSENTLGLHLVLKLCISEVLVQICRIE